MRNIIITYNSSGYLDVKQSDNASDKRMLEILKKAVKIMEEKVSKTNGGS